MIKKITHTIYKDEERGFEYVFEPIDDTIIALETETGFEIKYLCFDETPISPDDWADGSLFLVHYHRDFHIENKIITKYILRQWYQDTTEPEETKDFWVFPVAAYIHSGVVLSLGSGKHFPDYQWDVSRVGAVLASRKEFETKEKAQKAAKSLIKDWNCYLSSDVYCLVKENYDKNKKQIDYDVVGGYYGYKNAKECLTTEI